MNYNYFIDFADIDLPEEFWDKYKSELNQYHPNNNCLVDIDYSYDPGQTGVLHNKPEKCYPHISESIEIELYNIKISNKLPIDCYTPLYLELTKHMENDINIKNLEETILTKLANEGKEYAGF